MNRGHICSIILLVQVVFFPFSAQGQDTLLVSDARVSYTPFGKENDSTIYILRVDNGPSECDDVVVVDSLGRTLFRSFMKGDSCYNYDYFNDGTVRNFDLLKHEGDGFTSYVYNEQYCSNGQLIFKGRIAAMDLKHDLTYYHCNGKVQTAFSRDGICNDKAYNVWYEDGQLEVSGFYKDCDRYGNWIELSQNGDTINTFKYFKGIRIDTNEVLKHRTDILNAVFKDEQFNSYLDGSDIVLEYNELVPDSFILDLKKDGKDITYCSHCIEQYYLVLGDITFAKNNPVAARVQFSLPNRSLLINISIKKEVGVWSVRTCSTMPDN